MYIVIALLIGGVLGMMCYSPFAVKSYDKGYADALDFVAKRGEMINVNKSE